MKTDIFSLFCSKHKLCVIEGVLTSIHNLCFRAKIVYTSVNASFTLLHKSGFRGDVKCMGGDVKCMGV